MFWKLRPAGLHPIIHSDVDKRLDLYLPYFTLLWKRRL